MNRYWCYDCKKNNDLYVSYTNFDEICLYAL